MRKNTFNLLREPCGKEYEELLDYALRDCTYFLLVTDRENRQLFPNGLAVLEKLSPFLYKREMRSEWPGTILLNNKVPVYTFFFIPESATILKNSSTSLYQWQRPNLPDDLCLLRNDESPWLVTIAHEQDGFLSLSENEISCLQKDLPTFRNLVKRESDNI
jgi:hypothetical protein